MDNMTYCEKCDQFVEPYVREEPEYIPTIKRSVMQTRYRCPCCMVEICSMKNAWKNLERKVMGLRRGMKGLYIGTEDGPVKVYDASVPDVDPATVIRKYRELIEGKEVAFIP